MSHSSFDSLDALASSLPFHVDDVASANETYTRWRARHEPNDRDVVQLWTYCFIRRYFLVKFVQESSYGSADLDELIDKTFRKVEGSESKVRYPSRYASWVSVVCKNTFRNYLRDRRHSVSLDDRASTLLVGEMPATYNDVGLVHQALVRAIDRLPAYLRPCVRLRFLDGLSYREISDRTGHPLPRIRAYVYKAIQRLRDDDELLAYFE